jgi:hypothetical protein
VRELALIWQFLEGTICKKILRGFSPQANYTDRVTVACRRA